MKREWLVFLSAVQFLTRLPLPDPGWEDGRLDRAVKWFPLVGVVVGAVAAVATVLAALVLPVPLIVLIAMGVAVLVTGALHEDGLADTADGLGGGRDIPHRLKIMKDSSIGTYGALALIFAFGFRYAFYSEIAPDLIVFTACLFAAHTFSRLAMTGLVWSLPYARDEATAKVAPLSGDATLRDRIVAALTGVVVLVPTVVVVGTGPIALGIALTVATFFGLRALYARKLRGWTGDTAGATQVITEIAFLLGVVAWT